MIVTFIRFIFQNAHDSEEVDKLYQRNPILRYTKLALRAPLLALPYGHSQSISKNTFMLLKHAI
jgi:hypothetical protein